LLSKSFSLSEYTKIDVGWVFAPDPTGGAYNASQDPIAGFKVSRFATGGEWREGGLGGGVRGKGRERGGMRKGGERGS